VRVGWSSVRDAGYNLQPGHYSIWFLFSSYHNDARSNTHQIQQILDGGGGGSKILITHFTIFF